MNEISRPEVFDRAPVVSVLMTTYRHEEYIEEAIDGVVSQVCEFPIELVIGEDCSPDRTREIAISYVDRYPSIVRVITGSANIGLVRNTYRSLAACRGKFIAFCEGDDWWCDPLKLQKQIALFVDERVGMVHCDYAVARTGPDGEWLLSEGEHSKRPNSELEGCDLFATYMRELVPRFSSSVYRKALLDRFFSTKLGNLNYVTTDLPMTVFAAAELCIGYVPEVCAVYRNSPRSITRSGLRSAIRFLEGVFNIFEDIASMYGARNDFDPQAWAWVPAAQAKAAFRLNDRETFDLAMRRLRNMDASAAGVLPMRLRGSLMKAPALARCVNTTIDTWRG